MQHYHIWFDLKAGAKDLEFAEAMDTFLGHMQDQELIESWRLERRTLGLSGAPVGEFHVDMTVKNMGQLQEAFDSITPRTGDKEKMHAGVWSKVENLKFALYRDFPDENRKR